VTTHDHGAPADREGETPATTVAGLPVLHLFCSVPPGADRGALEIALKEAHDDDHQVVTVAMLGHKSDLGVLALGPSVERLRQLQTGLQRAGANISYSYVSLTEVSEYAGGVPEAMKMARLRPTLPPEGLTAFCFYPMSKRRLGDDNWYRTSYDDRLAMMMEHGASGRSFRGRVLQLVTGSTGLDDYEWGVTLFGRTHEDLKQCVYEMRFDQASARFAEFGPFLVGTVQSPTEVLASLGGL
jgi:chlorite dismutase